MGGSEAPLGARSALDAHIDSFAGFCKRLVMRDERPIAEIEEALGRIERVLRTHQPPWCLSDPAPSSPSGAPSALMPLLEAEHLRFLTSLEQLRWFYRIVEANDHGGNRQALGQYGRLAAEALRRHRDDERRSVVAPDDPGPAGTIPTPPRKR